MTAASTSSDAVVRHGPYPELTWPAVVVGWGLGIIIAVSIGYAALILGFSIEGSELAAILGFGILRGVMRRYSIVENNVAQTAVAREKKLAEPRAPNTVPDAPAPNAAPASAPLPRCSSTSTMISNAISVCAIKTVF